MSRWPGGVRVPNTNFYRAPGFVADDLEAFSRWAADEIERAIEREGPESVAAVFLEPVQNSGGCFPPTDGYFQRVREICDETGVLLVSDDGARTFRAVAVPPQTRRSATGGRPRREP